MWLFTKCGAISCVRVPAAASKRLTANGRRNIQVRARTISVLSAVLAGYCKGLDVSKIESTHGRDYSYRFYVDQADFATMAAAIALDVDYENFKAACSGRYARMLHKVWDAWAEEFGAYGRESYPMFGPGYSTAYDDSAFPVRPVKAAKPKAKRVSKKAKRKK